VIIVALTALAGQILLDLGKNAIQISSAQDRWLRAIHWLAWIGLGGGVVVIGVATFYFWVGQFGTLLNRVHTFLLLVAFGILLWFGQTYHLMDSSMRF
jgi:hypothetical protein